MKKVLLFMTLVLLAACQAERSDIPSSQSLEVFHATLEDPTVSEDCIETKVYADANMKVLWNENDQITIFNKYSYNQPYRFMGEDGDNAGGFSKMPLEDEFITGNELSHVYAIYPYAENTKISNTGVITYTWPEVQRYKSNSFGAGANAMLSVTFDKELLFRNAGGYLSFKFFGEGVRVKTIEFKGNNGEKLAGRSTITMEVNGIPATTMDASTGKESILLNCGNGVTLSASEDNYTEFWFVIPPMTLSKGFTVTVMDVTGATFEKSVSSSIVIARNTLKRMATLEVSLGDIPPTPPIAFEAVDLGLPSGTKWANMNLGATAPEEFGDFYAWGEVEPQYSSLDPLIWKEGITEGYSWESYKWCYSEYAIQTKYTTHNDGYGCIIDNKTVLEAEDDAAHVKLGDKWRMPTHDEIAELAGFTFNNPDYQWVWKSINGHSGWELTYLVNNNSIFLPATNTLSHQLLSTIFQPECYYWSSSLHGDHRNHSAYIMYCDVQGSIESERSGTRCWGLPIRPVYGDPTGVPVQSVALSNTELELTAGSVTTITATVLLWRAPAYNQEVTWTSDNEAVATVSSSGLVKAIAEGTATITVTSVDGGKTATCLVTVIKKAEETDADLNGGSEGFGSESWD